ncbi:MAG: hypothetical protein J7K15_12010 [Deltaproteobacteria bacterium]|nr:hypothetical protein [Deltaproteobacteria bacterium]
MNDTRWSKTAKKKAREAFEKAYERECADLTDQIRAKAKAIREPSDIWNLHDFLMQKRKEVDDKYDYRYSMLDFVFARLIKEGWLSFQELEGIGDDNIVAEARVSTIV